MSTAPEKIRPRARLGGHEGRLTGGYAEEAVTHFLADRVERLRHLYHDVIQNNKAHAVMLTEQGILDRARAKKLLAALQELDELGVDQIELDPTLEGIYPNIEALVIDRTGYDVGGMLYLGRSRGDTQKAPERMWHRRAILEVLKQVIELRKVVLRLAAENTETLMPGYTHMQHAQPSTFGYYMLWFADALETDFDRLTDTYKRVNLSPAEVGAGMTTSFPVSRERVADLLGFDGIIENAFHAHRGMDREIETLAAMSMLALDIYRLCEDFLVWTSSDVGFVELDDRYSATSFMMAQKKNPLGFHHSETAAVTVRNAFNALFDIAMKNTSEMVLRGGPAVHFAHEALDTIYGATRLITGTLATITLHKDLMREAAGKRFSQGTEVADALVRESGISFREAHRVVGTLVRHALADSVSPSDVTADMVSRASEEALGRTVALSPESLRKALDPMEAIRSKTVRGGVAPEAVYASIERMQSALAAHEQWLTQRRRALEEADAKLASACAGIIGNA